VESGTRGSAESGSRGNLKSWTDEALESQTCEIMWSDPRNSGVMNKSSEIGEKPSQRRYHKKFGFNVWTGGRLVNMWNQPLKSRDVKDIYVRVHIRNILWYEGIFGM
jgi:hypothetical protein